MSTPTAVPSPLAEVLPAKARRAIYAVLVLISTVLTGVLAGFAATGQDLPQWLIFTNAVVVALVTPFGSLALANVPSVSVVPGEVLNVSDEVHDLMVNYVTAEPVTLHAFDDDTSSDDLDGDPDDDVYGTDR